MHAAPVAAQGRKFNAQGFEQRMARGPDDTKGFKGAGRGAGGGPGPNGMQNGRVMVGGLIDLPEANGGSAFVSPELSFSQAAKGSKVSPVQVSQDSKSDGGYPSPPPEMTLPTPTIPAMPAPSVPLDPKAAARARAAEEARNKQQQLEMAARVQEQGGASVLSAQPSPQPSPVKANPAIAQIPTPQPSPGRIGGPGLKNPAQLLPSSLPPVPKFPPSNPPPVRLLDNAWPSLKPGQPQPGAVPAPNQAWGGVNSAGAAAGSHEKAGLLQSPVTMNYGASPSKLQAQQQARAQAAAAAQAQAAAAAQAAQAAAAAQQKAATATSVKPSNAASPSVQAQAAPAKVPTQAKAETVKVATTEKQEKIAGLAPLETPMVPLPSPKPSPKPKRQMHKEHSMDAWDEPEAVEVAASPKPQATTAKAATKPPVKAKDNAILSRPGEDGLNASGRDGLAKVPPPKPAPVHIVSKNSDPADWEASIEKFSALNVTSETGGDEEDFLTASSEEKERARQQVLEFLRQKQQADISSEKSFTDDASNALSDQKDATVFAMSPSKETDEVFCFPARNRENKNAVSALSQLNNESNAHGSEQVVQQNAWGVNAWSEPNKSDKSEPGTNSVWDVPQNGFSGDMGIGFSRGLEGVFPATGYGTGLQSKFGQWSSMDRKETDDKGFILSGKPIGQDGFDLADDFDLDCEEPTSEVKKIESEDDWEKEWDERGQHSEDLDSQEGEAEDDKSLDPSHALKNLLKIGMGALPAAPAPGPVNPGAGKKLPVWGRPDGQLDISMDPAIAQITKEESAGLAKEQANMSTSPEPMMLPSSNAENQSSNIAPAAGVSAQTAQGNVWQRRQQEREQTKGPTPGKDQMPAAENGNIDRQGLRYDLHEVEHMHQHPTGNAFAFDSARVTNALGLDMSGSDKETRPMEMALPTAFNQPNDDSKMGPGALLPSSMPLDMSQGRSPPDVFSGMPNQMQGPGVTAGPGAPGQIPGRMPDQMNMGPGMHGMPHGVAREEFQRMGFQPPAEQDRPPMHGGGASPPEGFHVGGPGNFGPGPGMPPFRDHIMPPGGMGPGPGPGFPPMPMMGMPPPRPGEQGMPNWQQPAQPMGGMTKESMQGPGMQGPGGPAGMPGNSMQNHIPGHMPGGSMQAGMPGGNIQGASMNGMGMHQQGPGPHMMHPAGNPPAFGGPVGGPGGPPGGGPGGGPGGQAAQSDLRQLLAVPPLPPHNQQGLFQQQPPFHQMQNTNQQPPSSQPPNMPPNMTPSSMPMHPGNMQQMPGPNMQGMPPMMGAWGQPPHQGSTQQQQQPAGSPGFDFGKMFGGMNCGPEQAMPPMPSPGKMLSLAEIEGRQFGE